MENLEKTISDWCETMAAAALENFKRDKTLTPAFLSLQFNEDNKLVMDVTPIAMYLKDGMSKDILSETIKSYCKSHKVVALMMITEAWVTKAELTSKGYNPFGEKKEVVMITFESTLTTKHIYCDIIREGDDVTLGQVVDELVLQGLGRFTNLLYTPPSSN